jgi:hypothetical protein
MGEIVVKFPGEFKSEYWLDDKRLLQELIFFLDNIKADNPDPDLEDDIENASASLQEYNMTKESYSWADIKRLYRL